MFSYAVTFSLQWLSNGNKQRWADSILAIVVIKHSWLQMISPNRLITRLKADFYSLQWLAKICEASRYSGY